jgi:hypothetical protein
MPNLTVANAKHLLARSLFGYSKDQFQQAMGFGTLEELVDRALLSTNPLPAAPGV